MAYQSLYRRRRPQTFADMIGQEHITRTLHNALAGEKIAHAYLFCGPRGTGKTTAAKIFARAMNCIEYPVTEPCNECSSCTNIASGLSIDVIEMDAASNRGIDEIRELRERSRFASGESRFKVYIIDEAHMLTPEACNAFLKTLEEPPASVVFILATTDPSRLPSTIVSRCQRFDFHLLTVEQIRRRLEMVLEEENWQADQEAVALIARLAEGSMRDALGILEQCSAYGEANISSDHVRIVTGATRSEAIGKIVEAAVANDPHTAISVLNEVVFSGRDLNLFLRDLTFVFSRLLLAGESSAAPAGLELNGFEEIIKRFGGAIERDRLFDAVELLHESARELRHAHSPQYILEINFIRLLRILHRNSGLLTPVTEQSPGVETRVSEKSESFVQAAELDKAKGEGDKRVVGSVKECEDELELVKAAEITDAANPKREAGAGERLDMIRGSWLKIVDEVKKKQRTTAAWMEPAEVSACRGHQVVITYDSEYRIHQERIMSDNHRKIVEAVLSRFCGDPVELKAVIGNVEIRNEKIEDPDEKEVSSSTVKSPGETISKKAEKKQDRLKDVEKKLSVEEARELFGGKIIDHD